MNRKEIGLRIKELRKRKGMSQTELASLMGYKDHSTLAKVETGINDITIETLYKYAKVLGVDVSTILNIDSQKSSISNKNFSNNSSIIPYSSKYFNETAELISLFRVTLRKFKNEDMEPDIESAKEELNEYILESGFPVYLAISENKVIGYIVLRIDGVVWVEQVYVKEEYRRLGYGSMLYQVAENVVSFLEEDTLYNFVHPNNDKIIGFLNKRGYSVLNLIELRKKYNGENLSCKIQVGKNQFDY